MQQIVKGVCTVWRMLPDCSQATFSTQCTHLSTQLSKITTAITGQTTIGIGMQSDLVTMGIKMSETCWDTTDYQ